MKIAVVYNNDFEGVINTFGIQNKEVYPMETIKAVQEALQQGGHETALIEGNNRIIDSLSSFMPKISKGEVSGMVFNMAYGIQGENRYSHVPSILEMMGIPYVGSSPAGHVLALDKIVAKTIFFQQNLPTPKFWVFDEYNTDLSEVEFPAIVKPKMESISFGLNLVYNEKELNEAVNKVFTTFQQSVLIEKYLPGREFAVCIFGNAHMEALPILEIDLKGKKFQNIDDKLVRPLPRICPAQIPMSLENEMKTISLKAYRALQMRDYARVDLRLDENGNVHILEVNSMASLNPDGSFAIAAKVTGRNYNRLINIILEHAWNRYFG